MANRLAAWIGWSCFVSVLSVGGFASAALLDDINPNATPLPNTVYLPSDAGWYYTPGISYNLTGISTYFRGIDNGTGDHTITVQIQSDRPVNGGTLLAQASFSGNSANGGILGGTFTTPVALQAGHTYFVDFLNISGMGTDFGQWALASDGVTHIPTAGATTRLDAWYLGAATGFSSVEAGNAADRSLPTGNGSAIEPILYFNGSPVAVTPEPSSIMMLFGVVTAAPFVARRYRRSRREASK